MYKVSDDDFSKIIGKSLDSLPDKYVKQLDNVLITYEDQPSKEQRDKLHLHNGVTLYGLYEGIPLPNRAGGYNFALPDRITIFKIPIEISSNSLEELKNQVRHTLWHEIAHYFGLDHKRIYRLDGTIKE